MLPVKVVGIPFDAHASFLTGAALAPARIIEAYESPSANTWAESGLDCSALDWHYAELKLQNATSDFTLIRDSIARFAQEYRILSLGGDHSISFPVIDEISKVYSGLTVLHLDAHADLYDDFEGNPFSHASPFARLMEQGRIKRLVQVGIRTLNAHQRLQAQKFGVEVIEMKAWKGLPPLDGPLYLSLDLDVLDPAFAPGVSHHEPGGFSSRDVIAILQQIGTSSTPLIGCDLVEYNPTRDLNGVTAMVAAKLMKEMLAAMFI